MELRELTVSLFANKANPFKHPLTDWQLMFATESKCWLWPEKLNGGGRSTIKPDGTPASGMDSGTDDTWMGGFSSTGAWWRLRARHWFRITAIMQKSEDRLAGRAIEGCKKVWGIARRLWLKKPPVGESLEAVLKASAGLSWQRHELKASSTTPCLITCISYRPTACLVI